MLFRSLLRPKGEERGVARFELVGECYVAGVMHGEFYEEKMRGNVAKSNFALV